MALSSDELSLVQGEVLFTYRDDKMTWWKGERATGQVLFASISHPLIRAHTFTSLSLSLSYFSSAFTTHLLSFANSFVDLSFVDLSFYHSHSLSLSLSPDWLLSRQLCHPRESRSTHRPPLLPLLSPFLFSCQTRKVCFIHSCFAARLLLSLISHSLSSLILSHLSLSFVHILTLHSSSLTLALPLSPANH